MTSNTRNSTKGLTSSASPLLKEFYEVQIKRSTRPDPGLNAPGAMETDETLVVSPEPEHLLSRIVRTADRARRIAVKEALYAIER